MAAVAGAIHLDALGNGRRQGAPLVESGQSGVQQLFQVVSHGKVGTGGRVNAGSGTGAADNRRIIPGMVRGVTPPTSQQIHRVHVQRNNFV